jgi:hypothetical protein
MSGKKNDITGKVFGKLTVIRKSEKTYRDAPLWECQCNCGKIIKTTQSRLEHKQGIKHCGEVSCVSHKNDPKGIDITGKVYGNLTVIRKTEEKQHGYPLWLCQCSCGKLITSLKMVLERGKQSCGCQFRRDIGTKCNQLTIVGFIDKEAYKCLCSCGNYTNVSVHNFLTVKSCGCAKRKINLSINSIAHLNMIVAELGLSELERAFLLSTEIEKNSIADTARRLGKDDSQISRTRGKVAKWLESNQLNYEDGQLNGHQVSDAQKPSILNDVIKVFNKDVIIIDVSTYWLYNAKTEQLILKDQNNITINLSSYRSETLCYDLVTLASKGKLTQDAFSELSKLVQMYLKK